MFGFTSTVVRPASLKAFMAWEPEPSTRTFLNFLRAALAMLFQVLQEMVEYPAGVQRAGARFGMELHGHERQLRVDEALVGAVVRVHEPLPEARRDVADGETMVLGSEI